MKTTLALILAILALASIAHCDQAQAPLPLRARLATPSSQSHLQYSRCKRLIKYRAAGTIPVGGVCPSGTNYEDGLCYPPTPGYDCLALNCYKHCGGDYPRTCYLHMCAMGDCTNSAALFMNVGWCT